MRSPIRVPIIGSLLAATLLTLPSLGNAGAGLIVGESTCTTQNCASKEIYSYYTREIPNGISADFQSIPFVTQIYAQPNECLRIEVTAATQTQSNTPADLEMVLVDNKGKVWRDDDSAGSLRPLIKAITSAETGYYTLQVHHWRGQGEATQFRVLFGRYHPSTNPNCSSPTSPLLP